MKISYLLEILDKLSPILEHYRDYTVDEMLNDIFKKCCTPGLTEVSAAMEEKLAANTLQPKPGKLSPDAAVLLLQGMNKEEQLSLLNDNKYKVVELKQIARCLNLKLGDAKKEEIKEIIVNRGRVTDRPKDVEEKKAEQNVSERVAAALDQIKAMQQEEIISYLNPYYKYEIIEIGRRLNLRIASSNRKDNIILLIAKHIGYKEVNRRISERPSRLKESGGQVP